MNLVEELTKIANAIRSRTGNTAKIKPLNFVAEINKLSYLNENINGKIETKESETITPSNVDKIIEGDKYFIGDIVVKGDSNLISSNIARGRGSARYLFGVHGEADKLIDINYDKLPWSGAYANQAVQVARSYWDARIAKQVTFAYSGGSAIFEGKLTDSSGNCLIDCSTYAILFLLGIDFNNSPYCGINGNNLTIDSSIIKSKSTYDWSYNSLLNQLVENFKSGKIRYAADLAEYFYCSGRVVDIKDVMPGDLTFHASTYDDGSYHINNRFKNISHVGVVAEEKYIQRNSNNEVTYFEYYNVTSITNVLVRTRSTARNDIVFCVRPDYRPRVNTSEINSNVNILNNTYHSGGIGTNSLNGMSFKVNKDGTIVTSGQPSEGTTFYLTSKSYPIYLKKGSYKLTGCPKRDDATSGTTWGLAIKKTDGTTQVAWDLGDGDTFSVTEDFIDVYVYIYVSSTKDATGYTWKPKLVRTA